MQLAIAAQVIESIFPLNPLKYYITFGGNTMTWTFSLLPRRACVWCILSDHHHQPHGMHLHIHAQHYISWHNTTIDLFPNSVVIVTRRPNNRCELVKPLCTHTRHISILFLLALKKYNPHAPPGKKSQAQSCYSWIMNDKRAGVLSHLLPQIIWYAEIDSCVTPVAALL